MLFKQLECFLVVARLGSMSRAAEEMFLTQPSLTARLKALEHEVGDELFVRARSGMRLTEAGRQFLPYAERSVASVANWTWAGSTASASRSWRARDSTPR